MATTKRQARWRSVFGPPAGGATPPKPFAPNSARATPSRIFRTLPGEARRLNEPALVDLLSR